MAAEIQPCPCPTIHTVNGIEVNPTPDLDHGPDMFNIPNDWYVDSSHTYGVKLDFLDNSILSILLLYNSDPELRMEDHVPYNTMDTDSKSIPSVDPSQERIFLVFESALLLLFSTCRICGLSGTPSTFLYGTLLVIKAVCPDGHTYEWYSQPLLGEVTAANQLLSLAILFSGVTYYTRFHGEINGISSLELTELETLRT